MNTFELSRNWFNFSFANPEKIKPIHTAIYFLAIDQCNRFGWKEKFGFPTTIAKETLGIRSYSTYIKAINDLVNWGFIAMIEKSTNQHTANVIALSKKTKALNKALDKALIMQNVNQQESSDSIDKQANNITNKQRNNNANKQEILSSKKWIVEISQKKKISINECKDFIEKFICDLELKDEMDKPIKELKKYFINWLNIKIGKENSSGKKETPIITNR